MTLRAARSDDLLSIVALLERASLPTIGVAESLDGFVVAEQAGSLVGAIGLERCGDRYALLRSAVVRDDQQNRGIGKALVDRAIAEAGARRLDALYLLTTTAEHYFPLFGFTPIPRDEAPAEIRATDEFTSACPASAIVMVRQIAEEGR